MSFVAACQDNDQEMGSFQTLCFCVKKSFYLCLQAVKKLNNTEIRSGVPIKVTQAEFKAGGGPPEAAAAAAAK